MRRADLRAGTPYLHVYWESGSYLEQVSLMDIDRTSLDSISRSSSADFASLKITCTPHPEESIVRANQ
jgi:hypothetical protein